MLQPSPGSRMSGPQTSPVNGNGNGNAALDAALPKAPETSRRLREVTMECFGVALHIGPDSVEEKVAALLKKPEKFNEVDLATPESRNPDKELITRVGADFVSGSTNEVATSESKRFLIGKLVLKLATQPITQETWTELRTYMEHLVGKEDAGNATDRMKAHYQAKRQEEAEKAAAEAES